MRDLSYIINEEILKINEAFLDSQNDIYNFSKEIMKLFNKRDLINVILDDINECNNEGTIMDGIEIELDDQIINVMDIYEKWDDDVAYNGRPDISPDFDNVFHSKINVVFTSRLQKNIYGAINYDFNKTMILINYNHPIGMRLLYDEIYKRNFNSTSDEMLKLVNKYLIPYYVKAIAHEIRHLIDDERTNNKMDKTEYTNNVNTDNVNTDDYLKQKSEIWARFSELLVDVRKNKRRTKQFNFNDCYQYLSKNFVMFSELDSKLRSKLTSYMKKFIDEKL